MMTSEHVKSPVLLRSSANQLRNTVTVSGSVSVAGATDQDLRDSIPSYLKVGAFLLEVLAKELQAARDTPAFSRYSSAADVMTAFKAQFEAYTRQYPPFSARSETWSKAIQYWRSLAELPEASVLAVYLIIIHPHIL
jgi:hypothetical protein